MSAGIGPGSALGGGRYLVEELVGKGGMATVYRARDTALGRIVAVKVMAPALSADDDGRERFRREARAVAAINHPGVVAVYDTGEEEFGPGGRVPYLVMEYVDGATLRERLPQRPGELPVAEALRLTAGILDALAASHACGMVHRDVKPANVMIGRDGAVKVMDFGIARALGGQSAALTVTGLTVGTPHYMSPEQFESARSVDGRSDLYAAGVVLFQLLTGAVPFDGESGLQIGYLHVHSAPPSLSSVGAVVPPAVEAVVVRALAKDPGERFADARAMRDEVLRVGAAVASGGGGAAYVPTAVGASKVVASGTGGDPRTATGVRGPAAAFGAVAAGGGTPPPGVYGPAPSLTPGAPETPGGRGRRVGAVAGAALALALVGGGVYYVVDSRSDNGGSPTAADSPGTATPSAEPSTGQPSEEPSTEPSASDEGKPPATPGAKETPVKATSYRLVAPEKITWRWTRTQPPTAARSTALFEGPGVLIAGSISAVYASGPDESSDTMWFDGVHGSIEDPEAAVDRYFKGLPKALADDGGETEMIGSPVTVTSKGLEKGAVMKCVTLRSYGGENGDLFTHPSCTWADSGTIGNVGLSPAGTESISIDEGAMHTAALREAAREEAG
ncbi:protein kinase [Streptomyces polyrhachis]|uniref:non-specific serine/threonine protein kinase n=1 Tax=Streptomyces polyrhachis TaxID=1282885 RepID=A0ABW2G931_9ACTN